MTTTTYLRVTTVDHADRRRITTLAVEADGPKWLTGWQVDAAGERSSRYHLIDVATVVDREPLRMNLHYGELEAHP